LKNLEKKISLEICEIDPKLQNYEVHAGIFELSQKKNNRITLKPIQIQKNKFLGYQYPMYFIWNAKFFGYVDQT
jgi:hypothetical protein